MMRITHAAIKAKDTGEIFIGKHHADCFKKYNTINSKVEQGFVTNDMIFVSREEAASIALKAKQIDELPTILFSEDFWSDMYKGKHDYDIKKGYVLKEI